MVLLQFSLTSTISTLAVAAVPELGFVLQAAGIGAALGSAVALRAQCRWRDVDTWQITTAWASLGLLSGVLIVAAAAPVVLEADDLVAGLQDAIVDRDSVAGELVVGAESASGGGSVRRERQRGGRGSVFRLSRCLRRCPPRLVRCEGARRGVP